jgi:hypothetical protein
VTTGKLPNFRVCDSQTLQKNWCLNNVLGIHARKAVLKLVQALLHDSVSIPIEFLFFISIPQLDEATNQLPVSEVIAVIKIEEDLVATGHFLKVDVVLEWNSLFINACCLLVSSHVNELRARQDILSEIVWIGDLNFFSIDSLLLVCRECETLARKHGCLEHWRSEEYRR